MFRLYSTKCWRSVGHQVLQPTKDVKFGQYSMFEKLQTGEKIQDAQRQPRTCSHPIYAQTLTGVCQAIRIFSPYFFHVFISTGTLESDLIYWSIFLWNLMEFVGYISMYTGVHLDGSLWREYMVYASSGIPFSTGVKVPS